MKYITFLALVSSATSCTGRAASSITADVGNAGWRMQESGSTASFRGVCAVSANVCWASGSGGSFTRTVDGGNTWRPGIVSGGTELDFRDVHAINEQTAWLLSAGEPGKIFKTSDGGSNWSEQYSNEDSGVFFDAFGFWDERNAIAFSDPFDGNFLIITTCDGGKTWRRVPPSTLPSPLPGEAGFAGSGTCLVVQGSRNVWIGTGGGSVARVLRSTDRGRTWHVASTPLSAGNASSGIFSLAFRDALHGVAVGGDYQRPEHAERNAAVTDDGGKTWQLVESAPPAGYRSCVAYVPNAATPTLVAVGVSGSDISTDDGRTWKKLGSVGYHSVSFASDGSGWAVGGEGRVARFSVDLASDR